MSSARYVRVALCCLLALASLCARADELSAQVNRLRDSALERHLRGDEQGALDLNLRAIRLAHRLPPTDINTVENYDDAGLYYFHRGDWEQSARHQATAVVLACGEPSLAFIYPAFLERLKWALEKYRPELQFDTIAENPLTLLDDATLALATNRDVRRRLFARHFANAYKSPAPVATYRLRREAVPSGC